VQLSSDERFADSASESGLRDVAGGGLVLAVRTTLVDFFSDGGLACELRFELRAALWDLENGELLWCSAPASFHSAAWPAAFAAVPPDWPDDEAERFRSFGADAAPTLAQQIADDLLGAAPPAAVAP